MKRDGFAFIETMIVLVVLTTTLIFVYSSFTKVLQVEKTKIYYNDTNYLYKTFCIKEILNVNNFLKNYNLLQDNYMTVINENDNMFNEETQRLLYSHILSDFDVSKIIVLDSRKLSRLKREDESYFTDISDNFMAYIKSFNPDFDSMYILVVEYEFCDNEICRNYYGWVGV